MPNCGTITVTTTGYEIAVGSTDNLNFRARSLHLSNFGSGSVALDISTTGGCASGYPLGDGEQLALTGLNGVRVSA